MVAEHDRNGPNREKGAKGHKELEWTSNLTQVVNKTVKGWKNDGDLPAGWRAKIT